MKAAVIIAIIIILILFPKKISLSLKLFGNVSRINLKILGITLRFKLYYKIGNEFFLARVKRNGAEVKIFTLDDLFKIKQKKISLLPIKSWLKLNKIFVCGAVGVCDDAFKTVFLAGIIKIFIDNLIMIYYDCNAKAIVRPSFTKNIFCLNMEGIFTIFPTHIIGNVITSFIKGRKTNASDRKSYEVQH